MYIHEDVYRWCYGRAVKKSPPTLDSRVLTLLRTDGICQVVYRQQTSPALLLLVNLRAQASPIGLLLIQHHIPRY